MTATVHLFPRRAAQIIPITAATPERETPQSITEKAIDALTSNYLGALRGHPAYLRALEIQSLQQGEPGIARLARAALDDLDRGVQAPCDVEPNGAA